MNKILVTGMGIISAIGVGKAATVQSLLDGKSGIGSIKYLKTKHIELPVGEVQCDDEELKAIAGYTSSKPITRTSLLGRVALKEALEEANINLCRPRKLAFISGTTVGGMEKSELYYHDFLNNDAHNEYIAMNDCGACTDMIGKQYEGKFDIVTTISTACSSAANAAILGANLIKAGYVDAAIVGGTECLSKFHLNGFNTLMILDKEECKPFDKNRQGLNLGEGAAYLVIESEESVQRRNVKPLCELSGYGNACDAFHQTASSATGEGACKAMAKALEMSGLNSGDIDYINAHGTGTGNNDESEGAAIMRIFGDKIPPVSSTKSFTGHTTSAAGGVESVISVLAMINDFIPNNLNFSEKIDSLSFSPVKECIRNVKLSHVMTNSFGFGGNDSSCILSKL